MTASVQTLGPGYVAGTWEIDPIHSDVSFAVRHMMVSKVRGRFRGVSGRIVTGADVIQLSLASVMGPPRCHEHGTTWRCQ